MSKLPSTTSRALDVEVDFHFTSWDCDGETGDFHELVEVMRLEGISATDSRCSNEEEFASSLQRQCKVLIVMSHGFADGETIGTGDKSVVSRESAIASLDFKFNTPLVVLLVCGQFRNSWRNHLLPGITLVRSPCKVTTPAAGRYLAAILQGDPTLQGVTDARELAGNNASTLLTRRWNHDGDDDPVRAQACSSKNKSGRVS